MKVYQINVVCGAGSTGRITVDLAHAVEMTGGKCRIAYGRGQAPADVDSFKISNKLDLYWHAIMTRLTDKHGLCSKYVTKRLIGDIQQYNPDIIHLHNIHGYYVNYELLFQFLRRYAKPVVWTMHDCWAFTGHCAHYESDGCKKWQMECSHCTNLRAYPKTVCGLNVIDNFRRKERYFNSVENMTIVTPSLWLKQQIEESVLKQRNCIVIPNGIDISKFKPQKSDMWKQLHYQHKVIVLGVASIWTHNKGFGDFIQLRKLLDEKYVICMVGLTRRQIKKLPEGIIGVNRTDSLEELVAYYSTADVFLNLTYEDTFPTTNIEALACGTPVITYGTGGSPEILSENCGIVVKKGYVESVYEAITKGLWRKNNCALECRDQAKHFDKEECYSKYISLYQSMTGRGYE